LLIASDAAGFMPIASLLFLCFIVSFDIVSFDIVSFDIESLDIIAPLDIVSFDIGALAWANTALAPVSNVADSAIAASADTFM
jgi:hypothetical protein